MKGMVTLDYQNLAITASREAWFNATEIAAIFGKKPIDWLRLPETERYIQALIKREKEKAAENGEVLKVGKSHFIKTKRSKYGGTWLHPKLTVAFARWLNIDFAIWCDEQIMQLLTEAPQWQQERMKAAAYTNIINEAIKSTLEAQGKEVKPYHYINEARLVNEALTGSRAPIDRNQITKADLKRLKQLTAKNLQAIYQGKGYHERKALLFTGLVEVAV